MNKCKKCKNPFQEKGNKKQFCSNSCGRLFWDKRRKELWPAWYQKNKEKRKLYQQERSKDPEIFRKRKKKYKEWCANNHEHLAAWYRKRRLDKKVAKKDNVIRWTNMNCEKNNRCDRCSSKQDLEFHHERYIKDCKYAITLCRKCHYDIKN